MFDFVKRSIIARILKQIDSAGLKKWPIGWIKVRRAANGWKLVIGYLVFVTPDILLWANNVLPGLLPAVGIEDATPIIQGVGSVLIVVGVIDKWIKFMQPVERRSDARRAAVIETAGVAEDVKKEIKDGTIPPGILTQVDIHREIHRRLEVKRGGLPRS